MIYVALSPSQENGDLPCEEEDTVGESAKSGQLLGDMKELQSTEPFGHRGLEDKDVGIWFARKSEKRLDSVCFVWRTLLRWGYPASKRPEREDALEDRGSASKVM